MRSPERERVRHALDILKVYLSAYVSQSLKEGATTFTNCAMCATGGRTRSRSRPMRLGVPSTPLE